MAASATVYLMFFLIPFASATGSPSMKRVTIQLSPPPPPINQSQLGIINIHQSEISIDYCPAPPPSRCLQPRLGLFSGRTSSK